jgi:UDP-glucose 4-epimerase
MATSRSSRSVLITGMAGGLAHRVAKVLVEAGEDVVGVDYRAIPALPPPLDRITTYRANYNKTAIEDVFRKHSASRGERGAFDAVLHLGRVGNLKEEMGKRFDLNVMGSQKLMNLCVQHRVKNLVVLSTFHIYGANPRNHIPIGEDDPLHAGADFPQIADAIQLDNMASAWVFKHPDVRTVVLRPTNVVGPSIHNTMSKFLRLPTIPYIAGYDPMTQFLHEDDLSSAVVAARRGTARGVFNVAGDAPVPWRAALELLGARTLGVPSIVAAIYLQAIGFPRYLVNFYKYPCIIGDAAFRHAFDWSSSMSMRDTLSTTRG